MPAVQVNTLAEVLEVARQRELARRAPLAAAQALGVPALPAGPIALGGGVVAATVEYVFSGQHYQPARADEVFALITDETLIASIDAAHANANTEDPKNPRTRKTAATPFLIARTL